MPFIDARLLLDLVPSRLLSTALLAFYRTTRNTISLFAQPAPLTLSVAAPASVSGTYPLDITSLQGGPVAVRGPEIAGVPSIGAPLSLRPAIWAYDGAALPPVRSWMAKRRHRHRRRDRPSIRADCSGGWHLATCDRDRGRSGRGCGSRLGGGCRPCLDILSGKGGGQWGACFDLCNRPPFAHQKGAPLVCSDERAQL